MNTATTHIEADKELVPEIRFEGFDGGIVEYLFNDIFLFSTGKNIKQKEASPEFETPCVRYGELYHMYNEVINKVINKTNLEKSELRFSKGDEILLPSAGEDPLDIGSASALTLKNVAIGRTINILRPMNVDVYSQIFASYYINQKLRKKISTLAKGSSISNVYNSDLKTLKINLPSLPEQQKIASFLSAVDEKIQQLTKKKELLEQYKKGVMQQLFSGQLRFKDENRNLYPDWEEKRLGEISKITTGSSNREDSGLDGEFTFFDRSKDIRTSSIYLFDGEAIIVPGEGQEFIPKYFIGKFDLHQRTYAIMNFENSISKFLFFYVHYHRHYFFRQAVGTTVKSLRLPMFKKMPVKLPCIEEQQKIASYLSGIDTKIKSVNNQITQTQTFKKGLLQQLFV
jgi:type I restriction enzyme S subunit